MKITPVHPEPPRAEHKMPFVPAFAVEGGRTIWLSGCGQSPSLSGWVDQISTTLSSILPKGAKAVLSTFVTA